VDGSMPMFRLTKRGGDGVCCDARGVALGPVGLVEAAAANGRRVYRVRPAEEVARVLALAYAPFTADDLARRLSGRDVAARALETGDMAKAAVATVLLKLPPLSPEAMAKLARDPTLKKYNPGQPRVPKGQPDGGQWARENDGEAANSRFPGGGEGVDGSTATKPVQVAENNVGRGNDATAGSASDRPLTETGSGTQAADASVATSRPLTPGEIELARSLFGDRIDYSKVRIHHNKIADNVPFIGPIIGLGQSDNQTVTPGNDIYFPKESPAYHDDFSASDTSVEHQAHLLHELTHVLQNQEGIKPSSVAGVGALGTYEYDLRDANGDPKPFNTFALEQQAEIVQDYFLMKNGRPPAKANQEIFPLSTYEKVLEIGTDGRIHAKVPTVSSGRREDDRR
jgi:hypothetical protein